MKINTYFLIFLIFQIVTKTVFSSAPEQEGFRLINEICFSIDNEFLVLRSQIEERAKQKDINFAQSFEELKHEKLLWVFARNKLNYQMAGVLKQADDHIKKILEDNKLTEEKFSQILERPPYLTTISQYRLDLATSILENLIHSYFASQISINDIEIQEELKKHKSTLEKHYDIVFISIISNENNHQNSSNKTKTGHLTARFNEANKIRSLINSHVSIDEIKKQYETNKNILISGPFAYEKNTLKAPYETELLRDTSLLVTKPFVDDGSVTMIWRIEKSADKSLDEKALLEKVREKLYKAAIERKINAELSVIIENANVSIKGCQGTVKS